MAVAGSSGKQHPRSDHHPEVTPCLPHARRPPQGRRTSSGSSTTCSSPQSSWESLSNSDATAYFARLAGQAGLDVARWQADLGTSTVADTVSSDAAAAANLHLNSTPSIFINVRLYTGSLSLDALRSAVAAAD